jgi:hypothetical protein
MVKKRSKHIMPLSTASFLIKTRLLTTLVGLFVFSNAYAQYVPFGFRQDANISLLPFNSNVNLKNPWVGGLNAPQFNEMDLDNNGTLDLVVFDRTGNKILTFKKENTNADYTYKPEWQSYFPPLKNWLIIQDYNNDGLADLFTSGGNGIQIFKGLSSSSGAPAFELVTDLLYSVYGNNSLNLYVSPVDIPAIADVDSDGDLDIITFYILGTCVEYHKNLSQELYSHSDSLIFELRSSNWGNFTESPSSNTVVFNDSCGRNAGRHSGSTMLLHDFDHDSDLDLFLGDVSYPELQVLMNQPQNGRDILAPFPPNYPDYSNLSVPVFPGAFLIHANQDNEPDLVIAPNTDLLSINTGRISSVFFNENSQFDFASTGSPFISHDIFDLGRNAYPVFSDFDRDGDQDIIVGNFGEYIPNENPNIEGIYTAYLTYLKNTGTPETPSFQVTSQDVGNLRTSNFRHLAPAAADLNGDLYPDLIVGTLNSGLLYLTQNPTDGTFSLQTAPSITVQDYAKPALLDLDNDNQIDLLVGGKSGSFQYFRNTGTSNNPVFTPENSDFSQLETVQEGLSNFGYSTPYFYNYDDTLRLFSGSESGRLFAWNVNPQGANSTITYVDSNYQFVRDGIWTSPAIADLNSDGFPELIQGNRRGGLTYYKGDVPQSIVDYKNRNGQLSLFPNPSSGNITINLRDIATPARISIYNNQGKLIKSILQQSSQHTIEMDSFAEGIYLVTCIDKNGNSSYSKFILTHND